MDRFPPVGSETGNELPWNEGGNPSWFWDEFLKRGRVWESGREKNPEDDPGERFSLSEVMSSEENGVKGGDLKEEMGEYRREVSVERPLNSRPLRFLGRRAMDVDAEHGAMNTV